MPEIIKYDPCAESVLWFVCFSTECSELMPWYIRLFVRGFSHVYAMRDYNGVTLIIDHNARGLIVDVSAVPATNCVRLLNARGTDTVLAVAGRLKNSYTQRGVQSCVSIVKSLLGIKAWHILTPQQLHDYLLENGGARCG
jgi:hypothetical protein